MAGFGSYRSKVYLKGDLSYEKWSTGRTGVGPDFGSGD